MNTTEKKMLYILQNLRKTCNVVSVKAEFEAEGTRTEELLRLLEIARRADVKIALKIGGCEAVRDLIEAKQFGYNLGNVVKYISRADLKGSHYEDLLKARWYLNREIAKFSPDTKVKTG